VDETYWSVWMRGSSSEKGLLGPYIASMVARVKIWRTHSYNLTSSPLEPIRLTNLEKRFRARVFIWSRGGPDIKVVCTTCWVSFANGYFSLLPALGVARISFCFFVKPNIFADASTDISSKENTFGLLTITLIKSKEDIIL